MSAAPRRLAAAVLGAALLTSACGLKPEVVDSLAATGGQGVAGDGLSSGSGDGLALDPVDAGAAGGEVAVDADGDGVVDPGTGEVAGGQAVGGQAGPGGGAAAPSGGGAAAPAAGGGGGGGAAPAPAGTTKGTTTGISKDKILIGIHAPLSGASPLPQGSFENGARKFWAGKKIFGRSVEVLTRDDKYTPSGAVRACEELSRETFIVLGAAGTDQIQACGRNRTLQSSKTPYISSGVTENGLRGIPTYFANSLTYKQQSPIVIANAKRQGFPTGKWALVLSETPNFADAKESMEAELKKAGIAYDYIPVPKAGTDSDAASLAAKLRSGQYPVVYFLGQPFFFAKTVQQTQGPGYAPTWTGPGPSMGVNSVLSLTCGSSGGFKASFLSPYHGLDKAPAGAYVDDVEMITAGSMMGVEFMLKQLTEQTLNRETLLSKLSGGLKIPGGIFPPSDYSRGQFGGTGVYALNADCGSRTWKTSAGPLSG